MIKKKSKNRWPMGRPPRRWRDIDMQIQRNLTEKKITLKFRNIKRTRRRRYFQYSFDEHRFLR